MGATEDAGARSVIAGQKPEDIRWRSTRPMDDLKAAYRSFMEAHVYPNEAALAREDDGAARLIADLRARAKGEGLWAPHLPPEAGGTGRGFLAYAHLNEEIGRSVWAQLVFNCQ